MTHVVLTQIEPFLHLSAAQLAEPSLYPQARAAFEAFADALQAGHIRAVQRLADGSYETQIKVKQGILLGFKLGKLTQMGDATWSFIDKDTFSAQTFVPKQQVRIVPGGSMVRRGAYVASGVTIMPPAYINVGAYVDEGTMVDSHALVGSCAQVGKRVHLSAAAQLGGVLEPIGAMPVVVEDDVLIGGNCGIYEGTIVRQKAVIAAGVVLTSGTKVFDLVNQTVLSATAQRPLEIPEGAVVVSGSRPASGEFAKSHGLSIMAPLIVKYRDEKTDHKTALEQALRG